VVSLCPNQKRQRGWQKYLKEQSTCARCGAGFGAIGLIIKEEEDKERGDNGEEDEEEDDNDNEKEVEGRFLMWCQILC